MVTVRRSLGAAFTGLLLASCVVFEAGGLQQAQPHGQELLAVETLEITENGAAAPGTQTVECAAFVLDVAGARKALDDAEPVSRDDYMHGLPWSPCLVRGRLALADGRTGTWTIRQYGTGSILFDDGGELFLHCPGCNRAPFVDTGAADELGDSEVW